MRMLEHPCILKCVHYFEDPKRFMLITDLCEGGELFDLVAKSDKLGEDMAAGIVKQILSAIKFMHNLVDNDKNPMGRIIHRDLKPENVLLTTDSDDKYEIPDVKLIDFGTAKYVEDLNAKVKDRVGTPNYMAPEVLKGKDDREAKYEGYDYKCDLWSVGIIAYVLLCGRLPLDADSTGDEKSRMQELTRKIIDFDP